MLFDSDHPVSALARDFADLDLKDLFAFGSAHRNYKKQFLQEGCRFLNFTDHEAEMQKWVPQLNIAVYEGKPDDRRRIREERIAGLNFNVLLTTFEYAMLDKRFLKKVLHSIGVYSFLLGSFAEPRTPMASIHDL